MHGSSKLCVEYNAIFILSVDLHLPIYFVLFIPHLCGHIVHFSNILYFSFLKLLLHILSNFIVQVNHINFSHSCHVQNNVFNWLFYKKN